MQPRLDCPKKSNLYYVAKSEGGLNPAIPRPKGSKLQFQNCVFYAIGRYAELWNVWITPSNAETFLITAKKLGLPVSQYPAAGAIAVWSKGTVGNSADGAGHVAVVEIVNRNDIVTSESGWSAKKSFWTTTRKNDGNWGQGVQYRFLGFIHPPNGGKTMIIKKGDKGEAVKKMQKALAAKGYLRSSEIDGDFGKITLGALLAFQFETGLEVDGICGAKTQAKLF